MIFKLFYTMTSYYLISCFYCIIQFGLEKDIRKERGCFREHVRGENKVGGGGGGGGGIKKLKNNRQKTQTETKL